MVCVLRFVMLAVTIGAVATVALLVGVLGGGSDGGSGSSGGRTTSYVPSSGTGGFQSSTSHNILSNPPKKAGPSQEIKNEDVRTTVEALLDYTKNSMYKNENNPGIDICNFDNGNAQCQSAAVLQSLTGVQKVPLEAKFNDLIKELNSKKDNNVSIKTFITDFANANFTEQQKDDNPLHSQLEIFLTGKTTSKNSNGHGVATTKTSPKTASATDYMTALMSLFDISSSKYRLEYHKRDPNTNYTSRDRMPVVVPIIFSENDKSGNKIDNLSKLIVSNLKNDKSFNGTDGIEKPDYFFLSTEGMLPAEILYVLSNWTDNGNVKIFQCDYRIKSMVCRKTPENLLKEGDFDKINTSGGTHFVCVQNDYNNKKFIEIDSARPGSIKSCSNDNVVNMLKDESGSYNVPVIIIFEKEDVAKNDVLNVGGANPGVQHPNVNHQADVHNPNDDDKLVKHEQVPVDEKEWQNIVTNEWLDLREAIYNNYWFDKEGRKSGEYRENKLYKAVVDQIGKARKRFAEQAGKVPKNLTLEERKKWLIENVRRPIYHGIVG